MEVYLEGRSRWESYISEHFWKLGEWVPWDFRRGKGLSQACG
jgi:hypothetical protein